MVAANSYLINMKGKPKFASWKGYCVVEECSGKEPWNKDSLLICVLTGFCKDYDGMFLYRIYTCIPSKQVMSL